MRGREDIGELRVGENHGGQRWERRSSIDEVVCVCVCVCVCVVCVCVCVCELYSMELKDQLMIGTE